MTGTTAAAQPRALGDLRDDTKGAVMVTGLFMACFLIGALWFVIGIGDTIVFRDRMQEATDHAAFASAALHAKGMNFISLCNLVLLTLVTIHIILGIIHDIALAICLTSFLLACGFWGGVRNVYTGWFKVLKVSAKVIHIAEVTASYGYPVMGLSEGMTIGEKYGKNVRIVPLSTSLMPMGLPNSWKKQGLPVKSAMMNLTCQKIINIGFDELLGIGKAKAGRGMGRKARRLFKRLVGGALEFRYCNELGNSAGRLSQTKFADRLGKALGKIGKLLGGGGGGGGGLDPGFDPFWGSQGPMIVYGPATNGSDWLQTHAVNFGPKMDDTSESRVGIARGTKTGVGGKYTTKEGPPMGYFSQSEFYFNCNKKWLEPECNDYDSNASFSIGWRARLRKLSIPNLGRLLAGAGLDMLTNLKKFQQFKQLQGKFGTAARRLFGNTGIIGMQALRKFVEFAVTEAEIIVKVSVGNATKGLKPPLLGSYH